MPLFRTSLVVLALAAVGWAYAKLATTSTVPQPSLAGASGLFLGTILPPTNSVPGHASTHAYQLQASTNLVDWEQVIGQREIITNPDSSFTTDYDIPPQPEAYRFYRLQVIP